MRGAQDDHEQLAKLTRCRRPQKKLRLNICNDKYFELLPKERARVPGEINSDPGPQRQRQKYAFFTLASTATGWKGKKRLLFRRACRRRHSISSFVVIGHGGGLTNFPLSLHNATPKVISLHDRKDICGERGWKVCQKGKYIWRNTLWDFLTLKLHNFSYCTGPTSVIIFHTCDSQPINFYFTG